MKTRTRTTKASAKASAKEVIEVIAPKVLPAQDEHPPKLFLLPESISKDATMVLLHHPRTLKPTRYYHCKRTGFYEIKRIASGNGLRKSLLLAPECARSTATEHDENLPAGGHIIQTAAFFAVTPIDPLFLLLPALSPVPKNSKEHKPMFLTLDDHIDALGQTGKHLSYVCRHHHETLQLIERRLAVICDTVTAGEDEKMYRLDHGKLLKHLIAKAETMVKSGLPPSMEAHFVKKPLQIPAAHFLQQEEQQQKATPSAEAHGLSDDSQAATSSSTTSITTSTSSPSSQSTTLTTPDEEDIQSSSSSAVPDSIKHTLRLRVALSFLFSSYIPAHLATALEARLSRPTSPIIDFTPLTDHLAHLAKLRSELSTQARETMMGDGRKRALDDDEEAAAEREEKKRKKEDDERRRKAGESRGVRDLKKVNVQGMKKMSDFFGKKGC
ncbi:MAG: hypothetical protein GOMPHAMPRED_003017 [Gomphillus americanus]|uniref:Ribonuclease H2 subunit B n=1 Tax=Gomphillus americanus TaxID=1940652 RepID=A0A8H3EGX4_9LECA|nr:MAG: hypothetical protein GOMPHAMPRED_003017 [Gomphillus americanus]